MFQAKPDVLFPQILVYFHGMGTNWRYSHYRAIGMWITNELSVNELFYIWLIVPTDYVG